MEHILPRQALQTAASASSAAVAAATTYAAPPGYALVECGTDNDFDGRIGLRVSAIFVILIGSLLGAVFPVFAARNRGVRVPEWAFFIAKYFGSGVIVATAFIHLLAPANDALTSPCLSGVITEYDWAEGIALMTIFLLFLVEVMAMRFATFSHTTSAPVDLDEDELEAGAADKLPVRRGSQARGHSQVPGDDHLSHSRDHVDAEGADATAADIALANNSTLTTTTTGRDAAAAGAAAGAAASANGRVARGRHEAEEFAAQMTAIFILEFGVIFHSIFIGLTLAVAGAEFDTLYVVLVFHQTFEGLGLGSRLAATPWPARRRWTPYLMGAAYAVSTPLAIAVGLGVRESYSPGSQTELVTNGVFDSISAGILIYTALVELMAHEFMFSAYMRRASLRVVLSAYGMMCAGAGLMALLGKWA